MSAVPPSSRSGRKAKGEGHSRRGEILSAAERIFVERGYEGATIRKIADEVGLSSTALYMHFADKGEILQEICRDAFARLIEATERLATLDRRIAATKAFCAQLSPSQQKAFDAMAPHGGMHGQHGMRGPGGHRAMGR